MQTVSLHNSINEMYKWTRDAGIETVFDRYQKQQPQCMFGQMGLCCQLCSHGPCRITTTADRGICGATADTIAARNWLRLAAHGASAYSHHVEIAAETLKATGEKKNSFKISDEAKLKQLHAALGLNNTSDVNQMAVEVADSVLHEIRKGAKEPSKLALAFSPKPRLDTWKNLGILGGGLNSEIRDCMSQSGTSINTDPLALLVAALRLSIAANYACLGAEMIQDILFGTPTITQVETDIGILDKDTVNIVAHGHEPFMAMAILATVGDPSLIAEAKKAGAKGIKVYGSMDTGQELIQRAAVGAKGIAGQLGNWITQEFWVSTGAVDLVAMDMNCTTPGLVEAASKFHTRLVSVSPQVRTPGVTDFVDYDPQDVDEQAKTLIHMAIEAYKQRDGKGIHIPSQKSNAIVGTAVESVLGILGGSLDPLLDAIKNGSIKGIAAVVGCTTVRTGHDQFTVALSKELIKRDILVINSGCVSSAVQTEGLCLPGAAAEFAGPGLKEVCSALGIPPCLSFGTCTDISRIALLVGAISDALGVDTPALPVAVSAPEYLEQKAVLYGSFALAYGLYLHLAPLPPVGGSALVTEILTQKLLGVTGGRVAIEGDPVSAADGIEAHINSKRAALGLSC